MVTTTKSNAQQFASQVSEIVGRARIIDWNKKDGRTRMRYLSEQIERSVRNKQLPYEYSQAAYGLNWAVVTGRVNTQTANAIESLNTRQMCALIHELMEYEYNIGLYPRYLMEKFA